MTKLVNCQRGVCRDEEMRAERLVIDGSNLVYHLYFSGLDQNRGGEYGAFEDLVTQFIGALQKCDIRPYVVFDGCADFSDQKRDTERERAEQRVKKAHQAAESGDNKGVLPTLIWEVFRQTLHGLDVPIARSFTEADRQAAALAQEWGCPVLSNDSDFFIFPMKGGMLPTAHFRWQEVQQCGAQSFIRCKRYLSSRFCEAVHIRPQLLPVFAVLAGNDYTKNIAGASERNRSQQQRAPYAKLQDLLQWISGFNKADPQRVFEEVLKNISLEERVQRISSLQEVADHYSLPPSSLSSFFNQDTLPPLPPQMVEVVPDWMRRPVTEAQFSSDFLDILTNQRVGLSVVVDHKDKPSANQVSLNLRKVLYGQLLGRDREVEERDRDGLQVIFTRVQTVVPQLSVHSLQQAAMEQRRQVLLTALGVTEIWERLSSLPSRLSHLTLPLAATCFWLKEARPPPDPSLLKVLLIGWCKGDTLRQNAVLRKSLNRDWCHWLNQWQSCLRDSFLLNQLLGAPLPEPPMAKLFSGILVHDLLHKMNSGPLDQSLQSYINDKDVKVLLNIAQQSQTGSPVHANNAASSQSGKETSGQASKRLKTSNASSTTMSKMHK